MSLCDDITELTNRALWETKNLMACIPDRLWDTRYDGIPMWKYLYHMLYSMDRWYINPNDPNYKNPSFHTPGLNDLNVIPKEETLSRKILNEYLEQIEHKISSYLKALSDKELASKPEGCEFTRLKLILGQFRHWHRHMGVIYGFIIKDDGKWPFVLNMCEKVPDSPMPNYY